MPFEPETHFFREIVTTPLPYFSGFSCDSFHLSLIPMPQLAFPEIPENTVHGSLHKFRTEFPDLYYLPVRGLYRHVKFRSQDEAVSEEKIKKKANIKEEDFYGAFADWIVNEIEEATKAISLGGNKFKDK